MNETLRVVFTMYKFMVVWSYSCLNYFLNTHSVFSTTEDFDEEEVMGVWFKCISWSM